MVGKTMEVDVKADSEGRYWECRYLLFAPLVIGCGVLISLGYYEPGAGNSESVPLHVRSKFQKFDFNGDGLLDIMEFHLAYTATESLDGIKEKHEEKEMKSSELAIKDDVTKPMFNKQDEILHLKCLFKPLDLNSMRKAKDGGFVDTESMFHIHGLTNWLTQNIEEADFPVANFSVFLPPDGVEVGGTWKLIETVLAGALSETSHLRGDRYTPPQPKSPTERLLMYLLTMFHPRPFLHMRFPPRGGMACLRAINERYYSIVFRLHPEFQLNEHPRLPFWFTPASLVGEIVITRDGSHIHSFNMHVPNDKSTNVDMEWITRESQATENTEAKVESPGEVDIGRINEMMIMSTSPSATLQKPVKLGLDSVGVDIPMDWSSEISTDVSMKILQREFYPFTRVPYMNFNQTFALAKSQKKLVHHILLWGAMDDQSC